MASISRTLSTSITRGHLALSQMCWFSNKPMGKLPKKLPIAGVKQVVLVSSAKGGVGKSLVSVNLAFALKYIKPEKQIGILDADVFGPSLPLMTGLKGPPEVNKQKMLIPLVNFGVKCMSMGFLVKEEDAVIWRGLMVMSAMNQLLRSVNWGHLDLLLVDMPPGTGDTQLSIIQNIAINGAIIVTTPQKVAQSDVVRGVNMFRQLEIPILGFVQNMNSYVCPKCNHSHHLFGDSLSQAISQKLSIDHLIDIPIDSDLTFCSDSGTPVVVKDPHSNSSKVFVQLANKISTKLNL